MLDRRYVWKLVEYSHTERPMALDAFRWGSEKELRAQLREESGLSEEMAALPSEWEQMLFLMRWVHGLSKHQGWTEAPDLSALPLLRAVRSGEVTFRCVEFSHMLQQVLAAFGIPARVMGLRRHRSDEGLGKAHVVVDAWSQEHGKWVELDPQLDTAYRDLSGRLLSTLDVHERVRSRRQLEVRMTREAEMRLEWDVVAAKDNQAVDDMPENEDWTKQEIWESLPDTGDFDGFARFWVDNHYELTFSTRHELVRPKSLSGAREGETLFLYRPGDVPPVAFQRMRQNVDYTSDRRRVDFPLNGVELQWEVPEVPVDAPIEETRQITLRMAHSMPWFDHYVVAVDDEVRQVRQDSLHVWLHQGRNRIAVTPVNDMQRAGSTALLTLEIE